jgi:hypothetical protein
MRNLLTVVATSLLLFSLSACAVGFSEQLQPEPVPAPPNAYAYPYPPTSYYPGLDSYGPGTYLAPSPVTFGFGLRFGRHGEHFEHGGHFAHAGHFGGHSGGHHG